MSHGERGWLAGALAFQLVACANAPGGAADDYADDDSLTAASSRGGAVPGLGGRRRLPMHGHAGALDRTERADSASGSHAPPADPPPPQGHPPVVTLDGG